MAAWDTITVTGKLSGVTKFGPTRSKGFTTSINQISGYTLIDLTNFNGQKYSNLMIDQLNLTIDSDFSYIGLDAFTWVKNCRIVLLPAELKALLLT